MVKINDRLFWKIESKSLSDFHGLEIRFAGYSLLLLIINNRKKGIIVVRFKPHAATLVCAV